MQHNQVVSFLPYKNVATAIVLCVFLGPIGLLYASFWGGLVMSFLGLLVVRYQFYYLLACLWIVCCVWTTRSVDKYNRRLFQTTVNK